MRHPLLYSTAIAALILVGGIAKADNMEKLGNMQATGTSMAAFGYVPQTEIMPTSFARISSRSSCRPASRSISTPSFPMRGIWPSGLKVW
jgi:hypothetical protein